MCVILKLAKGIFDVEVLVHITMFLKISGLLGYWNATSSVSRWFIIGRQIYRAKQSGRSDH